MLFQGLSIFLIIIKLVWDPAVPRNSVLLHESQRMKNSFKLRKE